MSSAEPALPIFPLPSVQLFPHALLPLHVFEPRYRDLVRDCLAGEKRLALPELEPGFEPHYYERPAVRPICGVGEICAHELLPDGRFNILLRGLYRARIVEELAPEHTYRQVVVEAMVEPAADAARAKNALASLRALTSQLASRLPSGGDTLRTLLSEHSTLGPLTDVLGAALVTDRVERRRLLESLDILERAEIVSTQAGYALARLANDRGPAN